MRAAAHKYFCDIPRCNATHVTVGEGLTESYIDLTEVGWKTLRVTGWKHYCPEHSDPAARKEAEASR